MPKYYEKENTGKGFITHTDNELSHVAGYPGNIWVTENTAWAVRVGAVEKTKIEAQTIVNTAISGSLVDSNGLPTTGSDGTQLVINLPQVFPPKYIFIYTKSIHGEISYE